jgi:hypothetical protein
MKSVASICKTSKQRGNALVLLLLVRTWDGAEAPDVYQLAALAHISPRQAERDLQKLVTDGEVERLADEVKGRGHVTRFRVIESPSHVSDKSPSDMTEIITQEISPSDAAHIQETTSDVADLSDSKPVIFDGVPPPKSVTSDGTPLAPSKAKNTSTDNHSSTSLQNDVGLPADAGSVEERAKALKKSIAELPRHKRCAQPSGEEWAVMLDIFAEWKRATGKGANAKLTPERGRALLDRLRSPVGFTREDFSNAIKGCRASPHHMGATNGTVYTDLELICRTDQHLERFVGYLQTPEESEGNVKPNRPPAQQFGRPPVTRDFSKFPRRAG